MVQEVVEIPGPQSILQVKASAASENDLPKPARPAEHKPRLRHWPLATCHFTPSPENALNLRQLLRIAGAGGPVLIGDLLPAKGLPQFLALRQAHQRTVEAHQPVSTPASDRMLRAIEGGQHAVAIQFAEGAFFEFGPGMGHRPAGDRFKALALGQLIEKLVPMALDRLDGLLQEKKHQPWESQLPLAGKV